MTKQYIGAVGGQAWTPSDTVQVTRPPRGFQVGVAGNVVLGYPDGSTVPWPSCVAGVMHPHNGFTRILATGTTATSIVVAY